MTDVGDFIIGVILGIYFVSISALIISRDSEIKVKRIIYSVLALLVPLLISAMVFSTPDKLKSILILSYLFSVITGICLFVLMKPSIRTLIKTITISLMVFFVVLERILVWNGYL